MFWKIMKFIPLTAIVLIVYNIIAFAGGDEDLNKMFDESMFTVPMLSGASWSLNMGQVLVFVALIILFFEIVKATRVSSAAIADHALSTLIFIAFLIEFLLVKQAGTSTFFLLMVISLIDVVAGYIIGIRVARRDLALGGAI